MAVITDPKSVKEILLDFMSDLIGTYTYQGGYEEPSISIGNPPNNIEVEGLEIIIPWFPDVKETLWTGRDMHREDCWNLILVLRSGNNLYEAVSRMTRVFPLATGVFSPQNDIIGTFPQYRFKFLYRDLYEGICLST